MATDDSSPQIFEHSYYQRLHDIEADHSWAMGLRDVIDEMFRKELNGSGQLRVLDAGCGTGYLLRHLERYDLDGEVTGLDYSLHAIEFVTAGDRRGWFRPVRRSPPSLQTHLI